MKRATKILYLPTTRSMRRTLAELDRHPNRKFIHNLSKTMEREVPKPRWIVRDGKTLPYEGP